MQIDQMMAASAATIRLVPDDPALKERTAAGGHAAFPWLSRARRRHGA
jgi:hypothetical protein